MHVKQARLGRKNNYDYRFNRDIFLTDAQIIGEMREINLQPRGLEAWCAERDHLADDLRILDLEVLYAKNHGGIKAAKAKRAEQKRLFIGWLFELEKEPEPRYAHHLAEQVVNYGRFLLSPSDHLLDPFKPFLRELSDIAESRRSERNEASHLAHAKSLRIAHGKRWHLIEEMRRNAKLEKS